MLIAESFYQSLQIVWDYLKLEQTPQNNADCIIVMGCHDLGVAHRAVELFQQGYSPLLLFSGGLGKITKTSWQQSEAETFAGIALQAGIRPENILLETKSTNCAENICLSMQLLLQRELIPQSVLLVTKPYLERRVWATFQQNYRHIQVSVSSQQLELRQYLSLQDEPQRAVDLMLGDLQRIIWYPQRGWQTPQAVPDKVIFAARELISQGFNQQLMPGFPI